MTTQLHPIMAAALRPLDQPQSEVLKIEKVDTYTHPSFQQSWDRAKRLEQELPECLRGNHL